MMIIFSSPRVAQLLLVMICESIVLVLVKASTSTHHRAHLLGLLITVPLLRLNLNPRLILLPLLRHVLHAGSRLLYL